MKIRIILGRIFFLCWTVAGLAGGAYFIGSRGLPLALDENVLTWGIAWILFGFVGSISTIFVGHLVGKWIAGTPKGYS